MSNSNVYKLPRENAEASFSTIPRKAGGRPTNQEMGRTREWLTDDEVRKLLKAALSTGINKLRRRNRALVLTLYRQGLRVSELCDLTFDQVLWSESKIHVIRAKGSKSATLPMEADQSKMLRSLFHKRTDGQRHVFAGRHGQRMHVNNVRELVKRLGEAAGFDYRVHPHQLRHSCAMGLVEMGHPAFYVQDYLGHRNIQHTLRYFQLSGKHLAGMKLPV
jgi:type 1 fimbriae regulatory protein FimB/type 1 fimbriae regulatory protein FimE